MVGLKIFKREEGNTTTISRKGSWQGNGGFEVVRRGKGGKGWKSSWGLIHFEAGNILNQGKNGKRVKDRNSRSL